MGNVVGGNVPPKVVHRNERLACSGSQPFGKAHPHQQRTDEPRSGGDRHCIDLGQREPGLGQCSLHDAADVFGVAAGGDLRHDAAVLFVFLDLGIHHRRKHGAAVFHHGGSGFITGGFNG